MACDKCGNPTLNCCDVCDCINIDSSDNSVTVIKDYCNIDITQTGNNLDQILVAEDSDCITWTKEFINGKLILTPTFNPDCAGGGGDTTIVVPTCDNIKTIFSSDAAQKNTIDSSTFSFLSTGANCDKIAPPTGFAITGNIRTSAYGKMEWYSTLALANAAAVSGETVLIFNDTIENLVTKNGVSYEGIGKHSIGTISCIGSNSSISNLKASGLGVNTSDIIFINTDITATTISVNAGSKVSGGRYFVTTMNVDTANCYNIYVEGQLRILGASYVSNSAVRDYTALSSDPVNYGSVFLFQGDTINYPKFVNSSVYSANNTGIYAIYSYLIDNVTSVSPNQTAIYLHGGGDAAGHTPVCTNTTGKSLTGLGIACIASNNATYITHSTINWDISNCHGISDSSVGLYVLSGNIRKCTGSSRTGAGILVTGTENPSPSTRLIDCIGESIESYGLSCMRDVFIYGGTFISRKEAINGNPIYLSKSFTHPNNYCIIGTTTIAYNSSVYAVGLSSTSTFPITARISNCNFTNPTMNTPVLGIDPGITLQSVTVDAYGNIL